MSAPGVVLDACVLVPVSLCDTLLRLAEHGLYRPFWSDKILSEAQYTLEVVHREIDPRKFESRLRDMNTAFPEALVVGWESLAPALKLPDPGDRHVLAAAIRCQAEAIVTANLRDFPSEALKPLGLRAVHPDDFLLEQLDLDPGAVGQAIREQADALQNPPAFAHDVLFSLERAGAPRFAREAQPFV